MTVSAHDVAAVLRARLPGLGTKKMHKLLYYCQGHHLATFGEPLFPERVAAWDMGPVVETLWRDEKYHDEPPPRAELDEAALNTVGYVLSRYGSSTGADLEHMTHSETPWRLADAARQPGDSALIRPEWMRDYFRTDGAPGADEDEVPLDSGAVSAVIRDAASQPGSGHVDDLEDLRAWALGA
jgi:uncharacterized phage-associated protein